MSREFISFEWKWHPRSADAAHNGSIYSEPITGHAYAIAMQPNFVSDEDWKRIAEKATRAVNEAAAKDKRIAELEAIARMFFDRLEKNGNWEDGCFYYHSISASELQEPMALASAALYQESGQ